MTRRDAIFLSAPLWAQASTKYRTAIIGAGWWGNNILRCAMEAGQSQVVGICDVDERAVQATQAEVDKLTGDKPRHYRDYREMLAKEKPEICIVATPDHWHALPTIAALKAGAHVYVEKPISHTLREGTAMLKTARATGKLVQVGTHRRMSPHCISGMEFLRSGKVGKIGMVRAFVGSAGGAGTRVPDEEPPKELDWDAWVGPAPMRPYNKTIHPRGFRQYMDFANGTVGDWGIHWFDQLLWWTEEKYPRKVFSTGGRFIRQDNTDAPDTLVTSFEFESFRCTWEHRLYANNNAEKAAIGCYFYGTEGTFHMGWRDGWTFFPSDAKKPTIHVEPQLNAPDGQNIKELWRDFLEAIAAKRLPACDIEKGHQATAMSMLAVAALRHGKSLEWDGKREVITNEPAANRLLERAYRKGYQYPRG
jgi:predicted dehydrogenase